MMSFEDLMKAVLQYLAIMGIGIFILWVLIFKPF